MVDDLTIEGNAAVVRSETGDLGKVWTEYGGDKERQPLCCSRQQINTKIMSISFQIAWTHQKRGIGW